MERAPSDDEMFGPHTHDEWDEIEEMHAQAIVIAVIDTATEAASFRDESGQEMVLSGVAGNIIEKVVAGLVGELRARPINASEQDDMVTQGSA
jgi:hypothetical protein